MFDTIKGVIGDIAAGSIKDQRIALSQEQLAALDLKLRDALAENTRLSQRVTELERLVADRDSQLQQLKPVGPPGERCPYCRQQTGTLEDIKPDPLFGELGGKIHYYKCSNPNCGKQWDKAVEP